MSSTAKTTSSVQTTDASKPPFGSRLLNPDADVWSQSAWDHVPPPSDQEEIIAASLERQRLNPVAEEAKEKYNSRPSKYWNDFYANNKNNFFRDRKWLHLEFPDLLRAAESDAGPKVVLEIGCGAGNAAFPLLAANHNPSLHLIACDYAPKAIKVVQENPLYKSPAVGRLTASVWDLTSKDSFPDGVSAGSVDIIILIFVLSALSPSEWDAALSNVYTMLKPGGIVLLRDYGRHDLTQLRFKSGRLLDDNFYIRGDGTRVYFFSLDELAKLFTGSPAPIDQVTVTESVETEEAIQQPPRSMDIPQEPQSEYILHTAPQTLEQNTATGLTPTLAIVSPKELPGHPLFAINQLGVDRRLLVNRKRQLKMYRVWMQGQFRKLGSSET